FTSPCCSCSCSSSCSNSVSSCRPLSPPSSSSTHDERVKELLSWSGLKVFERERDGGKKLCEMRERNFVRVVDVMVQERHYQRFLCFWCGEKIEKGDGNGRVRYIEFV